MSPLFLGLFCPICFDDVQFPMERSGNSMTRLWQTGWEIIAETDHQGNLQRFVWIGQAHHVVDIINCWRVDLDWWQEHIWREYLLVHTNTNLWLVLYCDLLTEIWYVQRLYD